jgi:hypothetical protein
MTQLHRRATRVALCPACARWIAFCPDDLDAELMCPCQTTFVPSQTTVRAPGESAMPPFGYRATRTGTLPPVDRGIGSY